MTESPVKASILELLKQLPDSVSWDEVQYRLHVRQQIEQGLADSDAGRTIDTSQMRQLLVERIQSKLDR